MTSTTVSISRQFRTGIWEVWCVRCRNEMGTMSSRVLMQAIKFAQDKGGVMCPSCRGSSCSVCGEEMEGCGGAKNLSSSLNLNNVLPEFYLENIKVCEGCKREDYVNLKGAC